ncbi:hypothetical protein RSOLAG1IB_11682 [Rhizoctonia solani AG-1 IB]|uniref:Retrotransposon gag domain-containing protein n=1 Tax=Thanatephorus cucumeris (strain AG1-IB / isolate 7/3/14) TaxID=1108050 RepID=A0A0B7FA51_THACB|nr:hypothetical protein RSOLAG1IB_11682 [Rhizoctonia solani AG-1 IB]
MSWEALKIDWLLGPPTCVPAPYLRSSSRSCTCSGRSTPSNIAPVHAKMATPSQLPSGPRQHLHQGLSAPFGETSTHPGSATLDEIRNLLQNLGTAISNLTARVAENEEVTKDVRTTVENISQTVNSISGKVNKPRTPPQTNPVQLDDKTPRPGTTSEKRVKLEPPANIKWCHITSDNKSEAKVVTTETNPVTSGSNPRAASIPVGPDSQSLSCTPGGSIKPIKFDTKEDVVTFLLVNMEELAWAWALPHLANMGSNKATITTAMEFDMAFSCAFFNPDEQQAAERKITSLVQTTTTATYATEFRTLLMSLDWNKTALCAQFYKGLHWHVKQQLAQKEDQPCDLETLIAAAIQIDNVCHELEISCPP